ncbi:MAG: diaminopimelate decarboxylase [Actinomycetota bacterium]
MTPPNPWPRNAIFGEGGLDVAGARATDLAERYGTPLFVVDEEDFRARARSFARAFPRVLFAMKAFPIRPLVRIAREEGLGLLASTGGELEGGLRAGVPAGEITLHGNNKSDEELRLAVEHGVGIVVADNAEELERLDRISREGDRRQRVLLRVIPGVEGHTHRYVDTGGRHSKFGTPMAEGLALQAIKLAATLPGLEFVGVHAHVGSQLLSEEPFLAEVEALLGLLGEIRDALGSEVDILDIGGGFGATYTTEPVVDPGRIAAAVLDRIRSGVEQRGLRMPKVVVEPGRALAANAVLTLYRVGSIKRTPGGPVFAAVDGGMSDNIRPALYGAKYTAALASRPQSGDARETFRVVGKHCESGDVLGDLELPADLAVGDLVAFASTGAYNYAMASNYNRVGRPAVVGVRDGRTELWLRREDVADLDRLDVLQTPVPDAFAPPGVEIRPARPSDVGSFLEHLRAVAAEGRFIRTESVAGTPPRLWRRRFRRSWTHVGASLVAVANGRVVGSLGIARESGANAHVAAFGMSVDRDRRGTGIGSALMSEAIRWARGAGVEKVSLSVYPHNTRAVALYRKFGFVEEGRLSGQSKKSYGYEDEVIMSRWLTPQGDPR